MVGAETAASRELRALNPSRKRRFVRLTDRVFVAAGYGGSTFAFVLGDTGIVAVDAGSAPGPAAEAIAELKRYSDLPIVGLVYTDGHIDHTHGAIAFAEENSDIEIWAIKPFGTEARTLARNRAEIAATRALRHFGTSASCSHLTRRSTPGSPRRQPPRTSSRRSISTDGYSRRRDSSEAQPSGWVGSHST